MATWINLSVDSAKAAGILKSRSHFRSSVSRSYYSAYAAVTSELSKSSITFGYGGNNPAHARLLDYVQEFFPKLQHSQGVIEDVVKAVRDLRRDRERADYMPSEEIEDGEARDCLRKAEQVLAALGVPL